MQLLRNIAVAIATGFGLGYSPVASGTAGALLGLPLVYFVTAPLSVPLQLAVAVALCLLCIPICDAAEQKFRTKDDGRVVADEYLTFPLCLVGLPATPLMLAVGFVASRAFDILKPPPAHGLQRLKGGLGITIDDVIANVYCLAFNHAAYWLVLKKLGWA